MGPVRLTLRQLLGAALLAAALLPAAVVSVVMLDRQYDSLQAQASEVMERTLDTMADDVGFKFSILSNNLQLFTRDRLLIQALDSFLFSSHAFSAMKAFVEQSPLVTSLYLLDNDLRVAEEFNGHVVAVEDGPFAERLRRAQADGAITDGKQLLLPFVELALTATTDGPVAGNGFAIVVPLYRHVLQEGLTRQPEGYLVAVVPWPRVYEVLLPHLKEREQVAVMQGQQVIAAPANAEQAASGEDAVVAIRRLTIGSTHVEQPLEFSLVMQVSRSARIADLQQAQRAVTITIIVILLVALAAALGVTRWLVAPFRRLTALVGDYGAGHYASEVRPFRFAEFEEVRTTLKQMGLTIDAQLRSLREQNLALEVANQEKEEYNRRLLSFNDELEARVKEKTAALSDSLRREEKSRQSLQALLHLGVELQQDSLGELEATALAELRNLYPQLPLAAVLREPGGLSPLVHVGLDESSAEWLDLQLRTVVSAGLTLPAELRHERRVYQLFPMYNAKGELLGVLALLTAQLDPADRDIMRLFCKQLAAITEGRLLTAELERMARTDALTNLPNRKAFDEALALASNTLIRFPERHFGLFVIDVNGLKEANDRYGHSAGDQLLEAVGKLLRQFGRKTDVVHRLGGDEFAILVQGGTLDSCRQLAERLQAGQGGHTVTLGGREPPVVLPISFSLGWASSQELPPAQLFREADARMYSAKQQYYREQRREQQ